MKTGRGGWQDMVSVTPTSFWGWPTQGVPAPQTAPGQQVPLDSQGNVDPNWAIPQAWFNPWDTATIQGIPVPGKVTVTCKKAQRVDKRQTVGGHGAQATMLGFDVAEVTMDVEVWTEDQLMELQGMFAYLQQQILAAQRAPRGNVQAAVEIQHPKLSMLAISKLYVRQLVPPDETGTPGTMRARVLFEELNPIAKGSPKTITGASQLNTIPNVLAPPAPSAGAASLPD